MSPAAPHMHMPRAGHEQPHHHDDILRDKIRTWRRQIQVNIFDHFKACIVQSQPQTIVSLSTQWILSASHHTIFDKERETTKKQQFDCALNSIEREREMSRRLINLTKITEEPKDWPHGTSQKRAILNYVKSNSW